MTTRHKISTCYSERVSFSLLFWLVGIACVSTAGGVSYAAVKNEHTSIRNEIRRTERNIADYNMQAKEYQTKLDTITSRWNMLSRLDALDSDLRDIDPGQIQQLRSTYNVETGRATASR